MLERFSKFLTPEEMNLILPWCKESVSKTIVKMRHPDFSFDYNSINNTFKNIKIGRKVISFDCELSARTVLPVPLEEMVGILRLYFFTESGFLKNSTEELTHRIKELVIGRNLSGFKISNMLLLVDCLTLLKENSCRLSTYLDISFDKERGIYYPSTYVLRSNFYTKKGGLISKYSFILLNHIPPEGKKRKDFISTAYGYVEVNKEDKFCFPERLSLKGPLEIVEKSYPKKVGSLLYLKSLPVWFVLKELVEKAQDCQHFEFKKEIKYSLCSCCYSKLSKTGTLINPYGTKVPKYISADTGKENTNRFETKKHLFGIELELENGKEESTVPIYKKLSSYLLCKSDGSLSNGIEIVTCPATYDVHKEKGRILFDTITKETKLKNLSTCGLHIHVSKKSLSTLQIGKIIEFIHNPKNKEFITKIAGRASNRFSSLEKERKITDVAPDNFNPELEERMVGVNLKNVDTIEFRIFASTTVYEDYMMRLDFVNALLFYTQSCQINVKSLSLLKEKDTFVSFLDSNKKEYPYLASFLGLRKTYTPQQTKGNE